jgi:3-phosphoinositide dependent protein kinase-1
MFFKDSRVIMIDFGSSDDCTKPELRLTKIDDDPRRRRHVNFVGTSQYMAPECARNQKIGMEADIWSLGCIFYQLITGLVPFRGGSDYLIFRRSTEARYSDSLACIPEEAKELIKQCL